MEIKQIEKITRSYLDMWMAYQSETTDTMPGLTDSQREAVKSTTAVLALGLARPSSLKFKMVQNGKLVGIAMAYKNPYSIPGNILDGIYVVPEKRGKGIARRTREFLRDNHQCFVSEMFTFSLETPQVQREFFDRGYTLITHNEKGLSFLGVPPEAIYQTLR